ncbi:metal ABC transporter substrate-binding protein [Aeromicrobium fastidiosum]|uniref:Zinc ABC transporter substrate-binding protein n=1 Tax=Aeromicrobium fastidiosum TaxID=52699 RepID=A0A641AI10_9ACTN|nr:metal ABC transporter substrate-binding protein [Aeromicrobium fastidiosum]KAA1372449.1 zinc ABC transporter substrate-binding protein [Aeromicrobium fastidiosum]MBP2391476.1 zinc transport system substrate-binding protein [Aeromicrobium fastidiosum]
MKKSLALLAVIPLVSLAACGGSTDDGGGAGGDKVSVAASFYPFAYAVQQVGGDLVKVDNLTSPGVEPHDLELKPKQVAAVQDADLVVFEEHFQNAVDEAVDQADRSDDDTVDVAKVVKLKTTQPGGEEEPAGDDHAEEGHDHGNEDPHTWLDPDNMIAITKAVESKLSTIDPDHADEYAANATAFEGKLTTLGDDFATGLKTCRTRTIVTSHAAFQYLAARYDLTQVPIAGIDPSNEPSPAQLADITQLVKAQGITTIFTEELVSPAIADTIAKETGATTATLDPIEGLSDKTKNDTYLTLMRKNLDTLKKANGCS